MSSDRRLRESLRRWRARREGVPRPQPDSEWGWSVEDRLARLEDQQRWVLRLVAGAVLMALLEIGLQLLRG